MAVPDVLQVTGFCGINMAGHQSDGRGIYMRSSLGCALPVDGYPLRRARRRSECRIL